MIKIASNEKLISSLRLICLPPAVPVYLALNFLRFYIASPLFFSLATGFLVLYGIFLFLLFSSIIPKNSSFWFLVFILIFCGLFEIIVASNNVILTLPQLLANIGFALAMMRARLNPVFYRNLFYLFSGFFIIHMALGVNPADIFIVSRNYISVFILLLISVYYCACEKNLERPSLLVPAVCQLIMLYGIGRAGILSGLIVLIGTVFFTKQKIWVLILSFVGLFLGIFALGSNFGDYFDSLWIGVERFERLAGGGQRTDINAQYLLKALNDGWALFFGVPLNSVPAIVEVDGNPHNSYIRAHINFGLFGLVVVSLFILASVKRFIALKKYMLIIVIIAITFRSAFDSTLFYGPLDLIVFYCILMGVGHLKFNLKNTK